MSSLREFIANRKAEIENQMKPLRKELAEIGVVERALEGEGPEEASPPKTAGRVSGKTNLKEMALEVLRSAPNGMAGEAIGEAIAARYGVDVAGESLSSLLSRLGSEQILTNDGFAWNIAASGEGEAASA
jgi:hypothetical protein